MPQSPFRMELAAQNMNSKLNFSRETSLSSIIAEAAQVLVVPDNRFRMIFTPMDPGTSYYPKTSGYTNLSPQQAQQHQEFTDRLVEGAIVAEVPGVQWSPEQRRRLGIRGRRLREPLGPQSPVECEAYSTGEDNGIVFNGLSNVGHFVSRFLRIVIVDSSRWDVQVIPLDEKPSYYPVEQDLTQLSALMRGQYAEYVHYRQLAAQQAAGD